MRVVYDVDDTLWDCVTDVYAHIGLTPADATHYVWSENAKLAPHQIEGLVAAYSSADFMSKFKFHDGYERIYDAEMDGKAEVWISSANLSKEAAVAKMIRLMENVPNINPAQVRLTVGKSHAQGRVVGDILVDDNVLNVDSSDFRYNILIEKPYTRGDLGLFDKVCREKNVILVSSLSDAVDVVEYIIGMKNSDEVLCLEQAVLLDFWQKGRNKTCV